MKQLNLVVDKYYKTRDGRKVTISKQFYDGRAYPFLGVDNNKIIHSYTANGGYWGNAHESRHDLIAEWEEPGQPHPILQEAEKLINGDLSILQEAEKLINGDRAAAYGDAKESFENVAKGWSIIVGKEVTGRQVGLMMAWLKICRENNSHKRDNLVDLAAYAALTYKVQ